MDALWAQAREQYLLSRESIARINQKSHDLKHQLRALRGLSPDQLERYLDELEDTVRVYESIVRTGNEVLDTILTEKSLTCKERDITLTCVADGEGLGFLNTVDLYAMLGNALDNAMEAVSRFPTPDLRQIEVLVCRRQGFVLLQVVNPYPGALTFREDLPVTTKEDRENHGYGLRSIRHIAQKYGGELCVLDEDGTFTLKILLPIPPTT
jgi:sensor histidine kinase regulating citrate/malate metabolism